jgi:SnoaL-like domain
MPTPDTLEGFIAQVERNDHVGALEAFYAEDCALRENHEPPRVGRDFHIAKEHAVFARARSVESRCVRPVFTSGDQVVIRWIFRFEWLDGTVTQMEELAVQRWVGERIAEEQFFYDPVQRVARPAGAAS